MESIIKLSDIVFDENIYPRHDFKQDTVNRYIDIVRTGKLLDPVILEEKTNRLLDGKHRIETYTQYTKMHQKHIKETEAQENVKIEGDESTEKDIGKEEWAVPPEEIPVIYHEIPENMPPTLYCQMLNSRHGEIISIKDRKENTRQAIKDTPEIPISTLAELAAVSERTIYNWIKDILAERQETIRNQVWRLHRLGWTQEEIAEATGVDRSQISNKFLLDFAELQKATKTLLDTGITREDVSKRLNISDILLYSLENEDKKDLEKLAHLNLKAYPYDYWTFSECDDRFGSDHPGRIPGQLIAQVLFFFTEPGDMVIDPMVGSGTTLDICLAMNRQCYGYDIDDKHERIDIISHDWNEGIPSRVKKANLIFWDPPYYKKMDDLNTPDGYGDKSISKFSPEKYLEFFERTFAEVYAAVKKGTKFAFLMSDWNDDQNENSGKGIFIWDYANLFKKTGWNIVRHIQAPLSTQQIHAGIIVNYREVKKLGRLERYLLIAQK